MLVRLLLLTLAGVFAGSLLGDLIAEPLAPTRGSDNASYAQHSANPDALVAQGETAPPCVACPDSYGVAARLRAERAPRMADAFRELGAVDTDAPLSAEPLPEPPDDGYRYGGRFPDPPETITPSDGMNSPAMYGDAPPAKRRTESGSSPTGEGLGRDVESLRKADGSHPRPLP